MKVLHLIKTPVGATWAVRQIEGLMNLGIDVDVAIPEGPRAAELRDLGVTVHAIDTDIVVKQPREARRRVVELRDLVQGIQPDVVHSHFVGTTITMRAAMRQNRVTPRVFQVPGPLHLENPVTARLELVSSQQTDRWIASCRWTKTKYESLGISSDRIGLSYYGVSMDDEIPQTESRLRQELEIPDESSIIGMVAYMYPPKRYLGQRTGLKGHEDLIVAVDRLRQTGEDAHLVFVGGAWNNADNYASKIEAMGRKRLGHRVHFLGTRNDVHSLYQAFDVAVHPSHSENVGGAVESLLAGVSTIATDVGGFPDVIIPGKTGRLVPPHDPVRLASTISSVLADPKRAKSEALAGRGLVRGMFDVNQTAEEVAMLYGQYVSDGS